MAKRDSRPARYSYRDRSFRPGSTCPRTSPAVPCCQGLQLRWCAVPRDAARIESISPCYKQYASPTEACWADRVRMRRTGVRPLYAVCQSERSFSRPSAGARRDCPPRVGPRPGSAWHMGTRSMARLTHRNASAGEALLWVATIPPPALAAGSGPPSILSLVPFPPVTHAPPSLLRACPGRSLSVHDPAAPLPSALLVLAPPHPPIPAVPPTDILSRERVKAGRCREHYMPCCFWPGLATHSSRPGVSEGRCSFEYPTPEVAAFGCPSVL